VGTLAIAVFVVSEMKQSPADFILHSEIFFSTRNFTARLSLTSFSYRKLTISVAETIYDIQVGLPFNCTRVMPLWNAHFNTANVLSPLVKTVNEQETHHFRLS